MRAAEPNPFFAMDTIAKGKPEIVVPLLKDLGYARLGGAAGDRAMAEALEQAGLRFFNGYLTLSLNADIVGVPEKVAAQITAMKGHDTALWLAVPKVIRDVPAIKSRWPKDDDVVGGAADGNRRVRCQARGEGRIVSSHRIINPSRPDPHENPIPICQQTTTHHEAIPHPLFRSDNYADPCSSRLVEPARWRRNTA